MTNLFTQDDFFNATGIDLGTRLDDEDNSTGKVNRFIRRVSNQIIVRILKSNPKFNLDKCTSSQAEILKDACILQALYMLKNPELIDYSGYDSLSNTVSDISVLTLSKDAEDMLLVHGLLYRGIR